MNATLFNSDSWQKVKYFFQVALKATAVNSNSWQRVKVKSVPWQKSVQLH